MENTSNAYHYARDRTIVFDEQSRFEKAEKIFLILQEKYHLNLQEAVVLDIGCSTGFIDQWLSQKVASIYGIDIDKDILSTVKEIEKQTDNFTFIYSSGDKLPFHDNLFDIIISNIMYYLLPHDGQERMFEEINRCLKSHGICYFAAPNRLLLLDGKYKLPFLCWTPVWLGKIYVKLFSRIKGYNEYYKTLFGLRKLVKKHFVLNDITLEVIDNAAKYKLFTIQNKYVNVLIRIVARVGYLFIPTYIFILQKK
jgi:SAM-dependent methyltransferase